jgi:hypothetical protein
MKQKSARGSSWVDKKLARGWTTENRKFIINQCKTSALASMPNSDDFASAYSKNSKKEYTFQEFQNYFLSNNLRCTRTLERVAVMKL